MTIKRFVNAKVQGQRMVLDSPIYFYQGDKDICLVIAITGNKYIYDKDTKLSFVIVKPNGEVVENAMSALINGKYNVLLTKDLFDGEDEVGQFLCQLRQHNGSAIVSLPPFAIHVLKGYSIQLDNGDGLLTEEEYMLLTENNKSFTVSGLIKISDLPQTENMVGYTPVTQGDTTYKLDMTNVASKTYVATEIAKIGEEIDLSNYATKEDLTNELTNKANKEHTHTISDVNGLQGELDGKAIVNHIHSYNQLTDTPVIPSLDGYATETYVQAKIAEASLAGGETDLSGYATKDDLKTGLATKSDVGHLHEQYLTEHQDISHLATKQELTEGLTTKAEVNHTHSYNDLTDKPTIPSIDGLATTEYVDNAVSNVTIDTSSLATKEELSDYALKTEIPTVPTKVSELTNDSGYLTAIPSEYVTETELDAKGYLTEHQDVSGLATRQELTDGLATKSDTSHTHTGMLTSTTITRIELVDALPEVQEENVLYIVRGE